MKWKRSKGAEGRDTIDIRGAGGGSSGGGFGGGGGLQIPGGSMAGAGGGVGLIVVLVIVAIQVFGGSSGFDVNDVFGSGLQAPGAENESPIPSGQDPQSELKDFSSYVFGDAQDTWSGTFERDGQDYDRRPARALRTARSGPTAAGAPPRRSARSTARPTSASTSTSASTRTWSASSALRATSPGRT